MQEEHVVEFTPISNQGTGGVSPSAFSDVMGFFDASSVISLLGDFFGGLFFWVKVLALFIICILILGILYTSLRINQYRKEQKDALKAAERPVSASSHTRSNTPGKSTRWERVLKLASSESEGDWRLAIIEADIILDELTQRMQYQGETLGERLKTVEKSDFNTINNAWEAHKVRNEIAHSGADYHLTKRETDRVINLFESVFKEFHYI